MSKEVIPNLCLAINHDMGEQNGVSPDLHVLIDHDVGPYMGA
jgi:hypothetical protein